MKLFIGLPAYRNILCAEQMSTWFSLGAEVMMSRLFTAANVGVEDRPDIDWSRNIITKRAVDWGADWLLMMDSDNWVSAGSLPTANQPPGKSIIDMIVTGREQGAAMVAAPVQGRRPHNYDRLNMHRYVDGRWMLYQPDEIFGKVQEVEYIGMGLCAINLAWLRQHWPYEESPWYLTEYTDGVLKQQGEDYYFCKGARDRGGKVLCDGRFLPGHKTLCD